MDKSFTHNNTKFASNWLRTAPAAAKEAQGITWVTPEEPPVVRAPVDREKSNAVVKAKDTAGKLLAGSDWMVIANVERSRVVAEDWATFRAAVIAEADRLEVAYVAAETYEDFDKIKPEWPLDPDQQASLDRIENAEEPKDGGV
tara:strand:- start:309 stop:740 length:432 start_codon:yes stop_codon:yes gene_type:complete